MKYLNLITLSLFLLTFLGEIQAQSLVEIDSTFGTNGFVLNLSTSTDNGFFDAVVSPSQSIYAVGGIGSTNLQAFATKYTSTGTLDPSYGTGGIAYIGNSSDVYFTNKVQLDADNKVNACGYISNQNNDYQSIWAYRLNTNGTPDSSFGTNGIFQYDFGVSGYNSATDIKVQPNGKIVITGQLIDSSTFDQSAIIFRLNSNGIIDSTFGTNGFVILPMSMYANLYSCLLQPDGKILVAGQDNSNSGDILVARLNNNGSFDNTFGTGGYSIIDINSNYEYSSYLQLQNDGKIVYTGSIVDMTTFFQDAVVGRLNTDGSIDSTYNNIGYNVFDINSYDNSPTKSKLLSNNSLLISGTNFDNTGSNPAKIFVCKIDSNGEVDSNFNLTGYKELITGSDDQGYAVDIDNTGKIILAGYTYDLLAESILCRLKESPLNLTVTSPNGGEQWFTNSIQNITWTATGVANVNISYTIDGGNNWLPITSNLSANPGTYAWTVPNTPSTDCYIKIVDAIHSTVLDSSNAMFSIVWPTSISNIKTQNLVTVSPNPANNIVKIDLKNNQETNINLIDIKGNIIYTTTTAKSIKINTANLSNGIYNLSAISKEGKQSQKIVIQH